MTPGTGAQTIPGVPILVAVAEVKVIRLDPPLRVATEADASELADLVNFAGEGLPLHIWTGLAGAGEDPWEIGRTRQRDKARDGKIVSTWDRATGTPLL